jgi:hypothetical protein
MIVAQISMYIVFNFLTDSFIATENFPQEKNIGSQNQLILILQQFFGMCFITHNV